MVSLQYPAITVRRRPWTTLPAWRVLTVLTVGDLMVLGVLALLTMRPQSSEPWALLTALGVATLNTDALLVMPALAAVLVTLAVLAASSGTKAALRGVLQLHAPLLCGVLAVVELELALLGLVEPAAAWDHLFAVVALSLVVLLGAIVVARSFLAQRKSERRFAKQVRRDAKHSALQLQRGDRYAGPWNLLLPSLVVALTVDVVVSVGLGTTIISLSGVWSWQLVMLFTVLALVVMIIVTVLGTLAGAGDPSRFGRASSFVGAGVMVVILLLSVIGALVTSLPDPAPLVVACVVISISAAACAGFGPAQRGSRWVLFGSAIRSAMLRNRYRRHSWAKKFLTPPGTVSGATP